MGQVEQHRALSTTTPLPMPLPYSAEYASQGRGNPQVTQDDDRAGTMTSNPSSPSMSPDIGPAAEDVQLPETDLQHVEGVLQEEGEELLSYTLVQPQVKKTRPTS